MKSKLNIVVRDSSLPCKPYSSTRHSFLAVVLNCDLSLLTVQLLTDVGPGGGRIYGEIEVPAGTYIVVGISTCKNVWTDATTVVADCGQDVCVNLIPRKFERCLNEMRAGLIAAIIAALAGQPYSFSSPPQEIGKDMLNALEQAKESLENLSKFLPKYELPVSIDDLKKSEAPKELIDLWNELQR